MNLIRICGYGQSDHALCMVRSLINDMPAIESSAMNVSWKFASH